MSRRPSRWCGPASSSAPNCSSGRAWARSRTATVADLGDFAEQMVFLWSFPPATFDLPVYEALRADLAASGEESLQPENLKASPMRSWIGLYALLKMIRDAGMTEFTREGDHGHAPAGQGRPDARHVRRRELDAEPQPPGHLQAGRHQPLAGVGMGSRRRGTRRAAATSSRARRSASTRSCAVHPSVPREPC